MKKKILNILKYSCGLIIASSIFIISLFISANAETQETSIIYDALNNAECELYDYNDTLVDTEQISFNTTTPTTFYFDQQLNGMYDQISGRPSQNYYIIIPLNMYINTSFLMTKYDRTNMINVKLYNNNEMIYNGGDDINFSFIVNEENLAFNKMEIEGIYAPDYINFEFNMSYDGASYQKGYDEAYKEVYHWKTTYETLENQYLTLNSNYENLLQQYNQLARGEYTFENLFWSVGSVPMAFIMQGFNVNVLGMNIAAIITGLLTALLVIWIIKKLLK